MNEVNYMKAAVLEAVGKIEVKDVPIPVISDHEVLVKIESCGICGSDIPRVLETGTYHFPTIPGHEFAGIVCELGNDVSKELLGKRVAVNPLIPCHSCSMCEVGRYAECIQYDFLGSRSDGGFAQYVKAPASNVYICPEEVDADMACMVEPITVALHVIQNCRVSFGDTVAVFGLGAIGMFVAQWAKAFGAAKVYAIDIDRRKVEIARSFGLEGISATETPTLEHILSEQREGVDLVIEASGAPISFITGLRCLRSSGVMGMVGRYTKPLLLEPATVEQILRKQLTIKGTWSFESVEFPHHAWKTSIEALEKGIIKTSSLISHILPLESTFHGIQDLLANKDKNVFKVIVKPQM